MLLNSTGSSAGAQQLRGGRRRCSASAPAVGGLAVAGVSSRPTTAPNAFAVLYPPPAAPCSGRVHRGALARASATASAVSEGPRSVTNAPEDFGVVIAGAGISGLTLALGLLKKGVKVQVLERDVTAIRGEGKIRGPIQVQSNALAALEAIDPEVAAEVMRHGCITGDRINGLCDGVSGDWYVKFDTYHPAVDRGLPVTRVISRLTLQEVLADAVIRYGGEGTIQNGCHVVQYEEYQDPATGKGRVAAILEDGRRFEGSVLVGTDGIWSKVRKQLVGDAPAHYSEYTCYTGISDYVPADIDLVGYRVFLGNGQYFVSSDVGGGKMQWYAFHKEAAGGQDGPGQRKARLLRLFGHWNYNVVDLIKATPEEDVLRRDIYDRAPMFMWSKGRVALMGDSAHAMQPNLGQGGCMAIEDAFELVNDLTRVVEEARRQGPGAEPQVERCLQQYQAARVLRVSAIHGMAGMAAFMASTYKAYLGEGLGPLSFLTDFQIHHPGRVAGQAILKLTMPAVLGWVLGGNTAAIESSRAPRCLVTDKPRHFDESEFELFMRNDDELAARANADWLLVAERIAPSSSSSPGGGAAPLPEQERVLVAAGGSTTATATATATRQAAVAVAEAPAPAATTRFGLPPYQYKAAFLNLAPESSITGRRTLTIGGSLGNQLVVEGHGVAPTLHATVEEQGPGRFVLRDAGNGAGTWVNGQKVDKQGTRVLHPGDRLEFGAHPAREMYQLKLQHASYRSDVRGDAFVRVNTGAMSNVA